MEQSDDQTAPALRVGTFAPLAEPVFRRIWISSLFSNFGQLILGVGAAWEMTRMSSSPSMVALVQTALMLPLMLVTVPAGALADIFDRRRIALTGLGFSAVAGLALTILATIGLVTPWLLLGFCVLTGAGVALYTPSWQASVSEQVSPPHLPAAIALGSISYNVARSFGPALGGVIVVALGAKATFGINTVLYIPLWIAYFVWRRQSVPSRLPPERIGRAIVSGARYVRHSPPIRTVLLRALIFGFASASYSALGPLIAKDLLHGDASTYGIMLGATGVGAVLGAMYLTQLRRRFSNEALARIFAVMTGVALLILSQSRTTWISAVTFLMFGVSNMQMMSLLNISVQLTAPRWVTARALSLYYSALTGGIAFGAWFWGNAAEHYGLVAALILSGGVVAATALLGKVLPLPREEEADANAVPISSEPEVALALGMRSGPVVVELEYDVDPEQARAFYEVAMQLQKARHRNGGFNWSIARDIADPALWIERYHCPTWGDYLRLRDRYTHSDQLIQAKVDSFDRRAGSRVRRWLERPYGSVRWKADSPDPQTVTMGYLGP